MSEITPINEIKNLGPMMLYYIRCLEGIPDNADFDNATAEKIVKHVLWGYRHNIAEDEIRAYVNEVILGGRYGVNANNT